MLWIVNTDHVSSYTFFVLLGEQGQGTLDRVLRIYLSSDHLIPGCLLTSSCVVSLLLTGESEVSLLLQVSVNPPFYCKLLRLRSLGVLPSQITLLELPFLLHQVLAESLTALLGPTLVLKWMYSVFRRVWSAVPEMLKNPPTGFTVLKEAVR